MDNLTKIWWSTLFFGLFYLELLTGEQSVTIENIDVVLGRNVIFKCVFNDALVDSEVILQKDDEDVFRVDINSRNKTYIDQRIKLLSSDANTLSLQLENASRSDETVFQCLRKRRNKPDTFADIKYVLNILVLTGEQNVTIENIDVVLGRNVIFKCVFNDALVDSEVILQKDDKDVFRVDINSRNKTYIDQRIKIFSSDANTLSLQLENASRSDETVFQCLRKRRNKPDTFADIKYVLNILVPPQMIIDLSNQTIWKDKEVRVGCNTTGTPVPKVWWKDTTTTITVASNESSLLNYTPKSVENITLYCVAENSAGNITTNITLYVRDPLPSMPLNFRIFGKSDPHGKMYDITVAWDESAWKGKTKIKEYYIYHDKNDERYKTRGLAPTSRKKTFSDLNVFQLISFSIEACNDNGCSPFSNVSYRLVDENIPRATLVAQNITSRNVRIKFVLSNVTEKPEDYTYKKVCFSPVCKKNTLSSCKCDAAEICMPVAKNESIVDVASIQPFCNYSFIGNYAYTNNIELKTEEIDLQTQTEAPGPAVDVSVNYIDNDDYSRLNVSWKRPVNIYSPFVKYTVKYFAKNKTEPTIKQTHFISTIEDNLSKLYTYYIKELDAYTNYTIGVVVESSDGLTVTGQALYKRTDESAPGPPVSLTIVDVASDIVSLKWTAPTTVPLVMQYRVTFYADQDDSEQTKVTDEPKVKLTSLYENTNYTIKVFSVLYRQRIDGKLESAAAVYYIKTKMPPEIVEQKGNTTLIIVTSIMLFLVLLVLIGSMCYCKRKDLCKSSYAANFYMPAGFIQETEFQPLPFSIRQTIRTAEANRVPMTFEEFEKHVSELHSNSDYLFSEEYASLGPRHPDKNEVTFENSKSEENRIKNRYQDIVAYDQTRVRLMSLEGVVGSNYINANFVDGYEKSCAYIATQAPLAHTLGDFWRMIWETKSRIIIMLTNLSERGRKKCEQYWPNSGTESYKNYDVTLQETKYYSNYTIHKLLVTRVRRNTQARESPSEPGEERIVWQYHYTEWPDFGVPQDRRSVIGFILRCRQHEREHSEPPIVHCSAGVGRTGTYIMLDSLMRRYDERQDIEVFCTLKKLRKQRNYLVQQEVQYIFIHDAILDYMKSGTTQIPLAALDMKLNKDSLLDTIQKQWRVVNNFSIPTHFCCCGLRPCNRPKNKSQEIIPVDSRRVRLLVQAATEGSDYINASYIDSFHIKHAYIVTQHPLKNTILDFWRMIWETNSLIIVNLMENEEMEQEDVYSYLPVKEETETTFGNYHIQIEEERIENNYICRTLKVINKDVKEIDSNVRQIFQYHFYCWPADFYPRMAFLFELLVDVARCHEKVRHRHPRRRSFVQVRDLDPPIVIHCKCGVGRSGMFAALLHLKEQIEDNYAMVDVFTTVHNLLSYRPFLIQNMAQYDYLYKAVLSLKHYLNKNRPALMMDL